MFKRTDTVDWRKMQSFEVTIIEIRPFRNGWHVYDFAPAAKARGTVTATEMPVVLTFVGV